MRLPTWYTRGLIIWLFAAPAFWAFSAALNGQPFFSFGELAGPSTGAGWQIGLVLQLGILAVLAFPLTALPIAAAAAWRESRQRNTSNAQD
jgi:hypothetical protein